MTRSGATNGTFGRRAARANSASMETSMPGASTPPANSPVADTTSKFVDVPKSTTTHGVPWRSRAAVLLGEAVSVVQPEDRLGVPRVDCEKQVLEVFFVRLRLADALGERLGSQRGLVALAAQLLDRHVARGEDLGARNDPRRPVL